MPTVVRRLGRSVVVALALVAIPFASVAAHECVIVNRSATGDAQAAANSKVWVQLTLHDLYSHTAEFGLPALTPAQVEYAAALAESWGVPSSFVWRADKTIAGDAAGFLANGKGTDGRGVDHAFEVYGEQLIGALFAALANA